MNDQLKELATKKNIASLLVIGILVLAIPLGVRLIRYQQLVGIFAAEPSVNFVPPNVETREGKLVATSATIGVTLTPPWPPAASANPSVNPSASPSPGTSPSPSASPILEAPAWDLKGVYDYTSSVTSCGTATNCEVGGKSKYVMDVTSMDTTTGVFQGVFYQPGDTPAEAFAQIKGTLSGSNLTMNYRERGDPSGDRYTVRFRGTVNTNGSMQGEALSSEGIKFEWRTTSGQAKKL